MGKYSKKEIRGIVIRAISEIIDKAMDEEIPYVIMKKALGKRTVSNMSKEEFLKTREEFRLNFFGQTGNNKYRKSISKINEKKRER